MTTINSRMDAVTSDGKWGLQDIGNGFHICRRGLPGEDDHWFILAAVSTDDVVELLQQAGVIPAGIPRAFRERAA